jgi:predicted Zn-dependent protease
MHAQIESELSVAARHFLRDNTMKSLLGIPEEALDAVMALAFQLYQARRYREVEVLCRGLIAADHTYWWSYSLYAAALRRLGKLAEALEQVERGLDHEPAAPRLLAMRAELRVALAHPQTAQRAAA